MTVELFDSLADQPVSCELELEQWDDVLTSLKDATVRATDKAESMLDPEEARRKKMEGIRYYALLQKLSDQLQEYWRDA